MAIALLYSKPVFEVCAASEPIQYFRTTPHKARLTALCGVALGVFRITL